MEVDIRKEVIDFIVRSKVFNECAVIDGITTYPILKVNTI